MLGQFLKSLRKGKGVQFKALNKLLGYKGKNLGYTERSESAYQVKKLVNHAEKLGYDVEIHFVDKSDKRNVHVYKPQKVQ
jgi:transcriptional regulator with XRE-family HTH domain